MVKMHGFRTGASRWLVLAGIFGALTALTLVEAAPHMDSAFPAFPAAQSGTTVSAHSPAGQAIASASGSSHARSGATTVNPASLVTTTTVPSLLTVGSGGGVASTVSPAPSSTPTYGGGSAGGSPSPSGTPSPGSSPSSSPSSAPSSPGSPSSSPSPTPTPTPTPSPTGGGTAPVTGGTITAGDSKANCITLRFAGGVLNQAQVNAASVVTGVTYNCLEMFANPMPTWSDWETPWMFSTIGDDFDSWLAASSAHQVVMGMDLIPQSVSNISDPLTWESACAAGDYDSEATTLAQNLVSYGAGGIVIRLGIEANGTWEADYTGTTTAEQNAWAQCYDNEVTAMRSVPGTHFLFVWNPNICTRDFALDQWYPGNSYVDIIGADAYDQDCGTQLTVSQEGWSAYANDGSANTPNDPNFPSLNNIEAFAVAHGKPMSFPEWGLATGLPDDAAYVGDLGQMFNSDDFAFQSYFDVGDDGIATLGPDIPNATAAYAKDF